MKTTVSFPICRGVVSLGGIALEMLHHFRIAAPGGFQFVLSGLVVRGDVLRHLVNQVVCRIAHGCLQGYGDTVRYGLAGRYGDTVRYGGSIRTPYTVSRPVTENRHCATVHLSLYWRI